MFGLARFKNEEYTYYISHKIIFSLCLGPHSLRTRHIHCISAFGLAHFMHFTNGIPIDRLLFHWYHWYQWYQSTSSFRELSSVNICRLQLEQQSAACFSIGTIGSNGTNRQIVYARSSGVNLYSLQIVYQSTNYFSNGIDLNQWHQSTNCLRTAFK